MLTATLQLSQELKDKPWPQAGGATASIRFKPELGYGANNGLDSALDLLKPVKEMYPDVSWADMIQIASAAGIEHAGGPSIPLRVGRKDGRADLSGFQVVMSDDLICIGV